MLLSSYFLYMCVQGNLLMGPAVIWIICSTAGIELSSHAFPHRLLHASPFPGLFREAKCSYLPSGPYFPYLMGAWQPTSSSIFQVLLSPDKAVHSHIKREHFFCCCFAFVFVFVSWVREVSSNSFFLAHAWEILPNLPTLWFILRLYPFYWSIWLQKSVYNILNCKCLLFLITSPFGDSGITVPQMLK